MDIFLILAVGLLGGVASGLMGIGGAVVMVPALVLIAGFSQHAAQGTTLCAMIPPIGILAAFEYYRAGHVDIKTAALIAAGFVLGALLGSKIAVRLNPLVLKKVFGVVLLYISVRMIISR